MKRILVVSQYFYPETFKINEVASSMASAGYEVDVVTGLPDYPTGTIPAKYLNGQFRDENYEGVNVHRVTTFARRTGPIFRLINYLSFAFSASRYIKRLKKKYDIVFIYQLSPVTMIYPALKAEGKKIVYCLDIWPESVKAMHINEKNPLFTVTHKISKYLYNRVDKVVVSSSSFRRYLNEVNSVPFVNMKYLPQHADDMLYKECGSKRLLNDDGKFHFIFTGNIGKVQDVETIVRAAILAKKRKSFVVDIIGDGSNLNSIKLLSRELHADNVIFHGRQSYELMPQYYHEADCCILSLKNDSKIGLTIPTKLQTYMSSGRPILSAIDGDSKKIIQDARCGVSVHASNVEDLAEEMDRFLSYSKDEMTAMGDHSRKYYKNHFTLKSFTASLTRIFEEE